MRLRISGRIVYVPKALAVLLAVLLVAAITFAGTLLSEKGGLPEVEKVQAEENDGSGATPDGGIKSGTDGVGAENGEKQVENGGEAVSESVDAAENGGEPDLEAGLRRGEGYCAVHITGQVANPGVYWLPEDAIVQDVVELAGGLTAEADTFSVNLARRIGDGMRLHIPSVNDSVKDWLINEGKSGQNSTETGDSGSILVNINTASMSELMKLSGVGESTAQDIISYREEHGNFASIEEIMNVPGIKEAKFNKMKKYITV